MLADWLPAILMCLLFALGTPISFAIAISALSFFLVSGEMPLNIETKGMFEYACHEGNYGMFNLLSGGRQYERDGRKNGVRKQIFAGVAEE